MVERVRSPGPKGEHCEGQVLHPQRRSLSLPEPLRLGELSADLRPKTLAVAAAADSPPQQRDGDGNHQPPRAAGQSSTDLGIGEGESGPESEPGPLPEPCLAEHASGFASEPVPEPGRSKAKLRALPTQDELYCHLCLVLCNGEEQRMDHLDGHKHRRRVHGIRARWQTWPMETLVD